MPNQNEQLIEKVIKTNFPLACPKVLEKMRRSRLGRMWVAASTDATAGCAEGQHIRVSAVTASSTEDLKEEDSK